MVITPEMIEMALSSKRIVTEYDDKHILLFKPFTCKKDEIDSYIANIDILREKGVNTPAILDYRKVKRVDSDYPTCVILEEKARGRNLEAKKEYLSTSKTNVDFEASCARYIRNLDDYINEISLRAEASDEVYAKLASDFLIISDSGLQVDPKPLNFFFDKDAGFTFIDINAQGLTDFEYLPLYLFGAVLGYGFPALYINLENYMYVDETRLNKIKNVLDIITKKIVTILEKYGYEEEKIQKFSLNWVNQVNRFRVVDDIYTISTVLAEDFKKETAKAVRVKPQNKDDGDWSIGW